MSDALFSNQWYRLKNLKPQVCDHVRTHRHYYRGALWYILSSQTHQNQTRVNAPAYYMFTQFDGERSVDEIWQESLTTLQDDAPTQRDVKSIGRTE